MSKIFYVKNVETYTLYSFFMLYDALLSLAKYIFQLFMQADITNLIAFA